MSNPLGPCNRWIRSDYVVIRADLIERFEIVKTQDDLLRASPHKALGSPANRRLAVHAIVRTGAGVTQTYCLKDGFKHWETAERAIAFLIRYINSDAREEPYFIDMGSGELPQDP